MTKITMPRLSDSMEQGTILTWLIEDGQPVAGGDELLEIETDKATQTHEAEADGLLRIVAPAGATVAVGATIAELVAPGAAAAAPAAPVAPAAAEPAPAAAAAPAGPDAPPAAPAPPAADAGLPAAAAANGGGGLATPIARRYARAHDLDLAQIAGSGPRGRITRGDVLRAIGRPVPPARTVEPSPAAGRRADGAPAAAPAPDGVTVREPTRLQRTIARRMVEAKTTIPEFQVETEVAMDEAIALRARLKQLAGEGDAAPSLNDMVVKAAALALRRHPLANASYRDDRFELHETVDVGIAVAADGALIVPVVRDADRKSLGQIAAEARALAGRVRDGASTAEDLAGGTFTVSNLGMFGMTAITPVINAPQAAILGVGALRDVLVRVDGEIVDGTRMTLTLSCDHRILYGADAARFLAEVKRLLEAPLTMAL